MIKDIIEKSSTSRLINHKKQDNFQLIHPQRCNRKKLSKQSLQNNSKKQLINQLQKQIQQLIPLKAAYLNIQPYYQKLRQQYQITLSQANHTTIMISRQQKESIKLQESLRELQIEYENLSDYLNKHLIGDKLKKTKEQAKLQCERFNQQEKKILMERQNLKELKITNEIVKQCELNKLIRRKQNEEIKLQKVNKILNQLKTKQSQQKIQIQSKRKLLLYFQQRQRNLTSQKAQLLSKIHSLTETNKDYDEQIRIKKILLQKNAIMNMQLKQIREYKEGNLNKANQKVKQLKRKLSEEQSMNKSLKMKTQITQRALEQESKRLDEVKNDDIINIERQKSLLLIEVSKSKQFSTYLKKYLEQLIKTSDLMYNQLTNCCKQDEKLLQKNRFFDQLLKGRTNLHLSNEYDIISKKSQLLGSIQNQIHIF